MVCSFIKESLAGKDTSLHTVFYEDEIDSSCYLPGRYATPAETADCLKQMAYAGRGRFHWYKIGGEYQPYKPGSLLPLLCQTRVFARALGEYTHKNAQVVTGLQTSCSKSVHKLSTSCARTACSHVVTTSLEQAVNNL